MKEIKCSEDELKVFASSVGKVLEIKEIPCNYEQTLFIKRKSFIHNNRLFYQNLGVPYAKEEI